MRAFRIISVPCSLLVAAPSFQLELSNLMDERQYRAAQDRTEAKLRYANVHLDELQGYDRRGDDFDRAHQESFLFHLLGVIDAYLQELNILFDCGLELKEVKQWKLEKTIKHKGRQSLALKKLAKLEKDNESWLNQAKEMRDHSTHRHSVPRVYHLGGEKHGDVFLTNTRKGKPIKQDYISLFEQWAKEMDKLINELRSSN